MWFVWKGYNHTIWDNKPFSTKQTTTKIKKYIFQWCTVKSKTKYIHFEKNYSHNNLCLTSKQKKNKTGRSMEHHLSKIQALLTSVKTATEMGYAEFEVQTDSEITVQATQGRKKIPAEYQDEIPRIRHLRDSFRLRITHNYREQNRTAHEQEQDGLNRIGIMFHPTQNLPLSVLSAYQDDLKGRTRLCDAG
ncbi:unnamed protein product [Cuscuta europaea]|uniref:RNase H type-1 domain-containing protein n=1 Tax=Cuscuta europaea TaxID=41803 RepID=A0A9P0YJZ8_CUSEU|nr:unnamed protein product [Cuscuta europaea]